MSATAACGSTYAPLAVCSYGGAVFDVVYTASTGVEMDRHRACFFHAVHETERHHAAAGIATCEMVGPVREPTNDDKEKYREHVQERF